MAPRQAEQPPPRPELLRYASTHSKLSLPSSSHSNEADDEQSLSDHTSAMDSAPSPPHYEGEDTRLTSDKELSGFYMYGWAAEVFVVCGIGTYTGACHVHSRGSFIPVTLEQLARENGVLLSDGTTPCEASFQAAPPSILSLAAKPDSGQCVVHILGVEINTASFAMYTFSISVLIQALLIISMSGAADHGRFRKTFLLWFAFIGSTATMLFLPIVPKVYILGAVLAIVANTCFGASFVLLNSFLPLLVRHHPTIQYSNMSGASSYLDDEDAERSDDPLLAREAQYSNERANEENPLDGVVDATTALLSRTRSDVDTMIPNPSSSTAPSKELSLSTQISSYGIAIGYIAALFVQTISIFIVIAFRSNFGLRLVLFVIGAWWFIFTIPSAMWLRPRPGPPLHIGAQTSNLRTGLAYFAYSWKSLGETVKHARRLKDVLLFLAAWFLLSDSIATVSGTAVLFAKTTLEMDYAMLGLINVIATLCGVLGAITWSRISIFLGLKPSHTILACIVLFELIPLYGLLGYIPAIQRYGSFGLQQKWEMYPLGAVYGFVLGGLSSYCRSLFGELIPPGFEAAFYALYAITDKGSSIFGPAIVGAITDRYGEIRPAFWFLAVLVGLPFPIMLFVDVERGRAAGIALAKELQALSRAEQDDDDEDDATIHAAHGIDEHEQRF
ncbi:autophagy-related protein 22-like protein [Massariosphaeria phaeospora]|uniref:Autophagy-related protein n=1 Tax=Massariosphaeria phaeospora TaxID=100035 RepID=A0A7C8I445_9PLEO|nr:autophagy-related protein 22-like protein [Massariosphaeria phaeospora]